MRVLLTGEAAGTWSGADRAGALASGWREVRPGDPVAVWPLGTSPLDLPGEDAPVVIDDMPDVSGWVDAAEDRLVLAQVPAHTGSFADVWRGLLERCGDWEGVRAWLSRPGRTVCAATRAPLLGADSVLASLAATDPARADRERVSLTALLAEAERAGRQLPLARALPPARHPGSGAGWGIGALALALGIPLTDTLTLGCQALAAHSVWEGVDLHIHAGRNLNTWDLPDSVAAEAAQQAGRHAVPFVVVAGEVGIGARERGAWGIDGALAARNSPADLADAGVRLARTWGIGVP